MIPTRITHRLLTGITLALLLAAALPQPARAQQSEADVYVARAILAYEDKRYDEALGLLRQALEIDPKNSDALYYTGLVESAQGRLDAAIDALEKARAVAPDNLDILYQLGVDYFARERYDRAEPLLTRVFEAQPQRQNVGYYVGFMRYRHKDYQGALRAFRAGTSTDPQIQQLTKFYSGLALAILGLPERAAAEVQSALQVQPTSPLTGPAERLRDAIVSARERERRFHAEVRVGAFYDTNVPVRPEVSNDPVAEFARRGRKASSGELIGLRADYSFVRTGPWEATVGYSFFQTYDNDLPSFSLRDQLGSLGGLYRGALGGMPYQIGLQYAYDYMTLGDDEFLQRHTVPLFATLVENEGNLTTVQGRFQAKEFANPPHTVPNEIRDANNWMAGFVHVFRFAADRHLIHLGYQFDREDAEGRNYDYLGHRALAGFLYTLPWGDVRLRYDFEFHHRDYTHTNSLLPISAPDTTKRNDDEQIHVVRLEKPLPYNLTLSLEYQKDVNRSNLALFTYERDVVSLILSWVY